MIKKAKTRVIVHKVLRYKDCPVYIRQIGSNYFEYLAIIKNELYSSYIEMNPAKGKKRLTKSEVHQTVGIILTGAITTIDNIFEKKDNTKKEKVN